MTCYKDYIAAPYAVWFSCVAALVSEIVYVALILRLNRRRQAAFTINLIFFMLMMADASWGAWTFLQRRHFVIGCELKPHKHALRTTVFFLAIVQWWMVMFVELVLWIFAYRYYDCSLNLSKILDPEHREPRVPRKTFNKFMIANILFWPIVEMIFYMLYRPGQHGAIEFLGILCAIIMLFPLPLSCYVTYISFDKIRKLSIRSEFKTQNSMMLLNIITQALASVVALLTLASLYAGAIELISAIYCLMGITSLAQ